MNRRNSTILIGGLLVVLAAASARAQVTTATFYGIVTDPTGAVVAGAEVTLAHEGTQTARAQTTDSAGEFVFNFVPVGVYTLRIQASGFKVAAHSGIELAARTCAGRFRSKSAR
jgi:type 1 fimbria pilin